MDPVTGSVLTSGLVSLLGAIFGGGNSNGVQMSQQQRLLLEDSLRNQNYRVLAQNPLYEMATQLAMSLMPRGATPAQFRLPRMGQVTADNAGNRTAPEDADIVGRAVPRGTVSSPTGTGNNPGRGVPGSGGYYPSGGTGTSAAIAALANGLPAPTSVGPGGINLQRAAELFRMPRQV
jgi:hypothetical protein